MDNSLGFSNRLLYVTMQRKIRITLLSIDINPRSIENYGFRSNNFMKCNRAKKKTQEQTNQQRQQSEWTHVLEHATFSSGARALVTLWILVRIFTACLFLTSIGIGMWTIGSEILSISAKCITWKDEFLDALCITITHNLLLINSWNGNSPRNGNASDSKSRWFREVLWCFST